jgi:Fe-S-cluster containining protein
MNTQSFIQRIAQSVAQYSGLVLRLFTRGVARTLVWLGCHTDNPASAVVGEFYVRTGACNQCGQCCQNIYLTYRRKVIDSIEVFNRVQQLHPNDYGSFEPIETTHRGVVFQCTALAEDKTCGRYLTRPAFCRTYPTEDSLIHGGKLPAECSYVFEAKHSFTAVLQANLK